VDQVAHEVAPVLPHPGAPVELLDQLALEVEVTAGGERPPVAGQYGDADRVIVLDRLPDRGERVMELEVHRVHLAARHDDAKHPVGRAFVSQGGTFWVGLGHGYGSIGWVSGPVDVQSRPGQDADRDWPR
jgi:hypothetical protein